MFNEQYIMINNDCFLTLPYITQKLLLLIQNHRNKECQK